jgi:hypothetical protein
MTEQNKLRWLRLLLIPYSIVSFICTFILLFVYFCGTILFGLPCWIFTGDNNAWVPDWDIEEWCPTLISLESFRDDINERQKELDRQKPRKNSK